MKEVLGARVQDVVVSDHFISSSSCFLRDSGMGGMTMEINPEDCIIEDLRKRSAADKNDSYVRNAALVLFNCADMYRQSCLDMLKTTQELFRNLLETMQVQPTV
ncbi:hypothetical protein MKX03_018715 [Papaver bracteatum]|nr:hypothetical protein MKX03_018715 [Papaver bracteatum]